ADTSHRRGGRSRPQGVRFARLDGRCGNRAPGRPRSGVRYSGEPMTFINIPANASVFLDANIFIYYFTPDPVFGPECQVLMERISKYQDFSAFTSTHVLSELSHQLMVLEAAQLLGWPLAGITGRLQKQPAEIQKLTRFRQAIDEVPQLGIEV